ncbi:MAG: hypothetical protein OXU94_08865 [Gammaproteobacteria bacterium]|nr:hypothetical protein [Gammaproteobacteria bacterium]
MLAGMRLFNLKALMTSGRQCGVAFIIAAVVHGFLGTGPADESLVTGIVGFAVVMVSSIQTSGGNAQ